jgi:SSS family solute:Na+ symporter
VGAGLSVALGVASTQTYVQAILVAKSDRAARGGALLSAAFIPPIGILSIFVGYHMRAHFPDMAAGQAFPQFLINYLPPALGGVFLATLLIAIVGTGSGMALGFGKIVTNDIYKRYINPNANGKQQLWVTRIVILASLVVSAIFTMGNLSSVILTFGFLSMGLRAVVLLVPMLTALFLPGRMSCRFAIASSVLGLASMLVGEWFNVPFDSLFLGIGVSALVAAVGLAAGRKAAAGRQTAQCEPINENYEEKTL